jgi:hypothetical protein
MGTVLESRRSDGLCRWVPRYRPAPENAWASSPAVRSPEGGIPGSIAWLVEGVSHGTGKASKQKVSRVGKSVRRPSFPSETKRQRSSGGGKVETPAAGQPSLRSAFGAKRTSTSRQEWPDRSKMTHSDIGNASALCAGRLLIVNDAAPCANLSANINCPEPGVDK